LRHILHTFQILVEMLHFAIQPRALFLGELQHTAVFGHGLQEFQALDGFLQRGPVC
jgi:hypothetical protein